MKLHFKIGSVMKLAIVGGIVLALGTIGFHAQASVWDKKTVLTVNQPIQVEDTYLEPGTYVFRLADTPSDRRVVQIFNHDQSHLINTIIAIPNYRLRPTGESRFTFYETPRNTVSAMHAWFYPGDSFGQEFRYPKQLHYLTVASTTPPPSPEASAPSSPEASAPPVVTEPESTPAPPQQAVIEPAPREEAPVIAQNNPPPAQPEVTPAPEQGSPEPPTELPKTGTLYPLAGLGGLMSLVGYALLRMTSRS